MSHALILGAVSDMAQAVAHRFGAAGFNLTLAARNVGRLDTTARDLEIRHNIQVQTVEFDALDFDSHAEFYRSLSSPPDAAIVVFGYLGDQETAQQEFDEAARIINTNYTGVVSILNIIANDFEQRQQGAIIAVSSVAGDRGRQSNYLYGSAKAGLTAYLSGLRSRLFKTGVHVVTVKPGFVRTGMTAGMSLPPLITAEPEQVAEDVFTAYRQQKNEIYTRWMWRYIMLIIKNIPEPIFKRLKL